MAGKRESRYTFLTFLALALISLLLSLPVLFSGCVVKEKKVFSVLVTASKRGEQVKIEIAPVHYLYEGGRPAKLEPLTGLEGEIKLKIIDPSGKEHELKVSENKTLPVETVSYRDPEEMVKKSYALYRYHANFSDIKIPGTYVVLVEVKGKKNVEFFIIQKPSKIMPEITGLRTKILTPEERKLLERVLKVTEVVTGKKINGMEKGYMELSLRLLTDTGAEPYGTFDFKGEITQPDGSKYSMSFRISKQDKVYYPLYEYGKYRLTFWIEGVYYEKSDVKEVEFEFKGE